MNSFDIARDKMRIFISYSHDEDWQWFEKNSLIPYLKKSLRREAVFWHDHGLEPGDVFKREIETEIDRADIALLLISQGFLNSEFIEEVELPRIIARAERNELEVIPLLTHPCLWKDFEFIARYQMVPGQPTPLIEYTGEPGRWSRAKFETLTAIKNRIDRIQGKKKRAQAVTETLCGKKPAWPAPDWPPVDRARLWFRHNDLTHNYCILTGPRVVFGRHRERADVRLYEVERCMDELRRHADKGVARPTPAADWVRLSSVISAGTGYRPVRYETSVHHSELRTRRAGNLGRSPGTPASSGPGKPTGSSSGG